MLLNFCDMNNKSRILFFNHTKSKKFHPNVNIFFRNQIRGLRAQYQKDVTNLKTLISSSTPVQNIDNVDDSTISGGGGNELVMKPIGFASTWHHTKNGTPRQGCIAKKATGILDFSVAKLNHKGMENPQYSLDGLEKFSHIWILLKSYPRALL